MKAIALAVLAGLCWGVGELCTKMVLHTHKVGPITAIAVRSTIALPLLWLAWWVLVDRMGVEPRAQWRALAPADVARFVLGSGLLAGGVAMICYYAALNLDDISRIKPIAFTLAPAVAAVLGWQLLGESMSARKAASIALIAVGVLLLASERPKHAAAAVHGPDAAAPPAGVAAADAPPAAKVASGR